MTAWFRSASLPSAMLVHSLVSKNLLVPEVLRTGVYQPPFSGVVHREADRVGAHSAGKAAAERVRGSFNGKLRDECLNVNWFENLWDARQKVAAWG